MITEHHQANTKTGFSTGLIHKLLNIQEVLNIHILHSEKKKKVVYLFWLFIFP